MPVLSLGREGELSKCPSSSQSPGQFSLLAQWHGRAGPFSQRKGQENDPVLKRPSSPLFLQSPTGCDCSLVPGSWEGPKSALHTRSMGPGHEQGGLWPPVSLSWQPLLPASSPQALQSHRGLPHSILSTPVTPIPISLQQNVSALCSLSLRDEGLRQPCWNTNIGDRAERVTHRRRQQSGHPLRWLGSRNAGGAGYVIPHSLSHT